MHTALPRYESASESVIHKPDCGFNNLVGVQTLEGNIPRPFGRARETSTQGCGIPDVTGLDHVCT